MMSRWRAHTLTWAPRRIYWIDDDHNRRRQRGLGKLTPVEFELTFAARLNEEAA